MADVIVVAIFVVGIGVQLTRIPRKEESFYGAIEEYLRRQR